MATTAVHGRNTIIKITDSGGTLRDISSQVKQHNLNREAPELEVTAYTASGREYIADFDGATLTFEGNAAATVMGYLHGALGVADRAFEIGPEGSTTGKRKMTGNLVLTAVNESGAAVGQANQFSCTARVSGAITFTTY